MNPDLFIAGDWGTSNLRLFLCEYRGLEPSRILDTKTGSGVSKVDGNFEEFFFKLIGHWIKLHGPVPVIISGMAGSTIGWKNAPYIQCPTDLKKIMQGRINFDAQGIEISIISGLKTLNPLGTTDVMRGEELQLLGWMQLNTIEGASVDSLPTKLFVLPGTHNKWALLRKGHIETFMTALTGELFALLKGQSILISDPDADLFDKNAFKKGVQAIENLGDAHLLHALFSTRSEQVLEQLTPEEAPSYLSGLLIASDVIGAMATFRKAEPEIDSVTFIGEQHLSERYKLVLDYLGIESDICDSSQIAIAGYEAIYKHIYL